MKQAGWMDEFGNTFPMGAWVRSEVREKWVPLFAVKPISREQRKALIESAINAHDDDGLLPDMERFSWIIDAVERAHGIGVKHD